MYNYLTATKNIRVVPLEYAILNTPDQSIIVIDREQEIIQNSPLQGNMFSHDTKTFLSTLKDLTVDTHAETWMKGKLFGQETMLELKNEYNGNKKVDAGNRWLMTT